MAVESVVSKSFQRSHYSINCLTPVLPNHTLHLRSCQELHLSLNVAFHTQTDALPLSSVILVSSVSAASWHFR